MIHCGKLYADKASDPWSSLEGENWELSVQSSKSLIPDLVQVTDDRHVDVLVGSDKLGWSRLSSSLCVLHEDTMEMKFAGGLFEIKLWPMLLTSPTKLLLQTVGVCELPEDLKTMHEASITNPSTQKSKWGNCEFHLCGTLQEREFLSLRIRWRDDVVWKTETLLFKTSKALQNLQKFHIPHMTVSEFSKLTAQQRAEVHVAL